MLQLNSSSSNHTLFNSHRLAPSVVMGLCCLIGLIGNICVVLVIVLRNKDLNFTLKMMLNLAVSDLLSLLTIPVWIYAWLLGWRLSVGACKFFSYLVIGSLYCSVLTVTLMSVQRYLMVLYTRHWAKLGGSGERALLSSLWILGGILACPALVLGDVAGADMQCRWNYRSDREMAVTLAMETLWGFVVPFSILVSSYCCLHKKVSQTAFFRSRRMTKLVTSIVVTFFVFWSPVHIGNVFGISGILLKSETLGNLFKASQGISQALTFLNSCVNPFIYAFAFRKRKPTPDVSGTTQDGQS